MSGQVDPQVSSAPAHFPAQSGVQPWQPVWVHSSPWGQGEPVAAHTQEPAEQESVRTSAVQSVQAPPPLPQVVADSALQVVPSQQPVQSLFGQVPWQPSSAPVHLPVHSGMQSPVQPVAVHSCPLPQRTPSAWQMHSLFVQVSARGSAVQSTHMPKPQVVSDGSMHLLP